jgi:hypothetical protein
MADMAALGVELGVARFAATVARDVDTVTRVHRCVVLFSPRPLAGEGCLKQHETACFDADGCAGNDVGSRASRQSDLRRCSPPSFQRKLESSPAVAGAMSGAGPRRSLG